MVGLPGQGYPAGSALFLLSSEAGTPAAALAGPFLALEAAGVLVAFASVAGGPAQVLLAGGQALALPYPKGLAGENPEAAALLEADVAAQLDAAGEPEGPVREFLGDPGTPAAVHGAPPRLRRERRVVRRGLRAPRRGRAGGPRGVRAGPGHHREHGRLAQAGGGGG